MKILYYTLTSFLDCDLPLIKTFRKMGHEVFLVFELLPYQLKSNIIDIKKQIPKVGLLPLTSYKEFHLFSNFIAVDKAFILNRPCKVYSWENVKLRREFHHLVEIINPDVIHCTNFIDIPDLFLYFYKKKIIQVVHDPFPHSGENTLRKKIRRKIGFMFIKRFVLLNENQKEEFIRRTKINGKYVFTNRLGTYDYLNYFKPTGQEESKEKIILFWGRISPYKGIEYLLEAMEIVHKQISNAKLVIAGAGHIYFDYSPYTNKNYIELINRYITLNELGKLLSSATVVVCPYTDATQSGVVMSSFTYQVPVVATDVGGLSEMIEDHVTGLLVPPKDSQELAKSLTYLLKSNETIDKYRKNIYKYCHEGKYSWQSIASEYIQIYRTIRKKIEK